MPARKAVSPRQGPTLRDVAAAAGVSVWTVSTAYSNPGRVAEATRQRVFDAAAVLGYSGPHPGARSLARGRTSPTPSKRVPAQAVAARDMPSRRTSNDRHRRASAGDASIRSGRA